MIAILLLGIALAMGTLEPIENIPVEQVDSCIQAAEHNLIEIATPDIGTAISYEKLGTYELTAYEWTGYPCADGKYPQEGFTAASNDPKLWHKWIEIEGYGRFYVHDRGGMASNVIDIYMGDYQTCINFGRRSARVFIVEE